MAFPYGDFQKKDTQVVAALCQIKIDGIDPSWVSLDAEFDREYG